MSVGPSAKNRRVRGSASQRLGFLDDEVRDVVDDQVGQLARRAFEGRFVSAKGQHALALRAGQDVDQLAVQGHAGIYSAFGLPSTRMKRVLFAALLAAALGMFAWTLRRFARMILAGRPERRSDDPADRVASVFAYFFGQKKVVEKTSIPAKRWPRFVTALGSKYHFIIFWGFIIITLGSIETLAQGLFPEFSWAVLIGPAAAAALTRVIDLFSAAVLVMVGLAFFRRIVLQPRLIPMSRDAAAILGAIGLLMVT